MDVPSLIPTVWNIGILLHKQTTLGKHFGPKCNLFCGFRPGGPYSILICPNQILQKSNVFWRNKLCPFLSYLNNFPPSLWFGKLGQGHFIFFRLSSVPSYTGSIKILNEITVFNFDQSQWPNSRPIEIGWKKCRRKEYAFNNVEVKPESNNVLKTTIYKSKKKVAGLDTNKCHQFEKIKSRIHEFINSPIHQFKVQQNFF